GHAWGEIYFEGFGWQRFEPTPGGGLIGVFADGLVPAFAGDSDWWGLDDWDLLNAEDFWEAWNPGEITTSNYEAPAVAGVLDGGGGLSLAEIVLWSATVVSGMVLLVLFGRIIWILFLEYGAKRKGHNDAAVYYFYRILKYMKAFDFELKDSETAMQFSERVGKRFGFEDGRIFMEDIAMIFSKAQFSGREITAEERRIMSDATANLNAHARDFYGLPKYLLYKYITSIV
ncbi:MAG: transglutaminase domain-containing protein, partial [Defluviitaleaceae bacterium]|nr:transglutaminase domain-containing protein [Defluviitaleaceae bacterium]